MPHSNWQRLEAAERHDLIHFNDTLLAAGTGRVLNDATKNCLTLGNDKQFSGATTNWSTRCVRIVSGQVFAKICANV